VKDLFEEDEIFMFFLRSMYIWKICIIDCL